MIGQHTGIRWRRGIWIVFISILCLSGLLHFAQVITYPALMQPLSPPNPDSWLRLTIVRQWLTGSDFYSHLVATNAPVGGISSHWTRPLDIVLAVFVRLMPASGIDMKLLLAATWYPVCLALTGAALLAGAAQKLFRHNHVLACTLLLMVASPYMADYFKPGDADHHGLMSVLWYGVILAVLVEKPPPLHVFFAGVLSGIIIWMSPEGLLPLAAVLTVLGVGVLDAKKKDTAGVNALFLIALGATVTTSLGLLVEIPVPEILTRQTYDSLSIVHVVFLGLTTAGLGFMALLWPFARTVAGRVYVAAAAGVAVLLLLYAIYPKFFLGPLADVDLYILTHFLPAVQETKPLFSDAGLPLLRTLMEPAMAAALLAASLRGKLRRARKFMLLKLAGLLGLTFALACYQGRFGYYLEPVAIITCAALLPTISISLSKFKFAPRRWQPYLWLALAFAVTTGLSLSPLLFANTGRTATITGNCLQESRYVIQTGQLQKLLVDKSLVLYTFEDTGGEALFFTPFRIVASNYHREGAGLKDMQAIREAENMDALHKLLKKRQVGAMLYCPVYHTKKQILNSIADDPKRPKWLTPVKGLKFMKQSGDKPVLLRVEK